MSQVSRVLPRFGLDYQFTESLIRRRGPEHVAALRTQVEDAFPQFGDVQGTVTFDYGQDLFVIDVNPDGSAYTMPTGSVREAARIKLQPTGNAQGISTSLTRYNPSWLGRLIGRTPETPQAFVGRVVGELHRYAEVYGGQQ